MEFMVAKIIKWNAFLTGNYVIRNCVGGDLLYYEKFGFQNKGYPSRASL